MRDLTHLQLWTAMTVLVVAVILVALRPLFSRLASVDKLKRRAKTKENAPRELNVFRGGLVLPQPNDPRWTVCKGVGFRLGDISIEWRGVTHDHKVVPKHMEISADCYRWVAFVGGALLPLSESRMNEYGRAVCDGIKERRRAVLAAKVQESIEGAELPGKIAGERAKDGQLLHNPRPTFTLTDLADLVDDDLDTERSRQLFRYVKKGK